jgi:hypothetical protein
VILDLDRQVPGVRFNLDAPERPHRLPSKINDVAGQILRLERVGGSAPADGQHGRGHSELPTAKELSPL